MFTFDQLKAFIAVAEELHFSRAAERLHMSQPPLTRLIQRLEGDVGVRLFDRDNRNVRLSYAGKVFLTEARRLVAHAEDASTLTRRAGSGSYGILQLGFTPVSGVSILGDLLARMNSVLPNVEVILKEQDSSEGIQERLKVELDVGLARPTPNRFDHESVVVQRDVMVAAVPQHHRLASLGRPLVPADFAGEDLLSYDPAGARYFTDRTLQFLGATAPKSVQQVTQNVTVVSLVGAGRGVALVADSTRRLQVDGVTYLPLDPEHRGEPLELHALWHRDNRNPALEHVVDILSGYQAPMMPELA
ncbi:LysR substrate-binding domain-containing protein [Leucobacter sp. M11]|uniref:LysR substrate-binding domain-containing protein n=1 Tax=Leucobacter sp. M11 TaxID=2993565 RepID=UPI002D7EAEE3|nr:LysR substrate-binding domain-containing protein [Leucobacter sp. M11]MEB4615011.1 LysR substrate-binding domain-containing protein [Leucobacter sp. M11]